MISMRIGARGGLDDAVWSLAIGFIAVLTAAGIGGRYWVNGHLNAWFCLLSLFFSTNLLICYCETCLFRQLDLIRQRAEYWRAAAGGNRPVPSR